MASQGSSHEELSKLAAVDRPSRSTTLLVDAQRPPLVETSTRTTNIDLPSQPPSRSRSQDSQQRSQASSTSSARRRQGGGGGRRRRRPPPIVNDRVIFSTPAHYDQWMMGILALPVALLLVPMIAMFVDIVGTTTTTSSFLPEWDRSGNIIWILGGSMMLIVITYMIVLPQQIDMRSDGTIAVKSFLFTYPFDDVCHAYVAALGPSVTIRGSSTTAPTSSLWVPAYRLATCFDATRQLVLRRRHGKWDIVLSPSHTEDFLRMLQSLITKIEIQRGTYNVVVVPDAAATGSVGSLTTSEDLERGSSDGTAI